MLALGATLHNHPAESLLLDAMHACLEQGQWAMPRPSYKGKHGAFTQLLIVAF